MFRKRGAPTLIELMQGQPASVAQADAVSESSRRATGAEAGPKGGTRLVETKAPLAAAATARMSQPSPLGQAGEYLRGSFDGARIIWFLVAGVIILAVLIWAIAYSSGKRAGRDEFAATLPKEPPPATTGARPETPSAPPPVIINNPPPVNPLPPTTTSKGPSAPPIAPPSRVQDPTPPVAGSLQKGLNYLVVAHCPQQDADEAVRYLASNGFPAVVVPVSPTLCQVVVSSKGYTREQMKDSSLDAERESLKDRVKKLGRQWKAENKRAPTDFAQCYFARQ